MIQTANFVLEGTELVPESLEPRNIQLSMKNVPQGPKLNPTWSKNGPVTTPGGLSDGTQGEKMSPDSILRSLGPPWSNYGRLGKSNSSFLG